MGAGTVDRDWALFQDWCAAAGHQVAPVTLTAVTEFIAETAGKPSTKRRYVRSIRTAARHARLALQLPEPPASSTIRTGEGWVNAGDALAQLPTTRFPVGLRGRRDGWLVVLLAELHLTRRHARALTASDIEHGPGVMRVADRNIPLDDDPRRCPRCAATRWLRLADAATAGRRDEIRDALYVEPDGFHDCATPLPSDALQSTTTLLPAIDRHGWVAAGAPMSPGGISQVMKLRQRPTERPDEYTVRQTAGGRFAHYTNQELADAYDDVDAKLEALLAQITDVLDDGDQLAGRLDELTVPEG